MTQQHGFDFESLIIEAVTNSNTATYKSQQSHGHTSIFDIDKGRGSSWNYSIKASKNGKYVWTSDILRFYDCTLEEDFKMVVGCWRPSIRGKEFDRLFEFSFKPRYHSIIWDGLRRSDIEKFCNYVKSIPHGREAQQEHSSLWKEKRDKILSKHPNCIVSINAKIDSGKQRRVQSGMLISDLIDLGITHREYDERYNGISLPIMLN